LYLFSGQFSYNTADPGAAMPAAAQPFLEPGGVYRTHDLLPWGQNAPRLAQRLVRDGLLRQLRHGVFEAPRPTKFGLAPAADDQLVQAYLGTDDYVFTGSARWNALGLGATGVQAVTLVYNKKRTVDVVFGKRRFLFRRVAYPSSTPPAEWFAVDLLRHCTEAGVSRDEVLAGLAIAVAQGRLDGAILLAMAKRFARAGTVAVLVAALDKGKSLT